MRIGLVGTESDHAADFLRMINRLERSPGDRIVAIWGEEAGRSEELVAQFGQVAVVASPDDMAGEVDAALLVGRNGNLHRAQAQPFLGAGLPVFIDKPLACSLADAKAILDAARRSGSLVMSASALRWQPDTDLVASKVAALGGPIAVTATGTFYPDSPYGGSFFYGIHAAELAVQFAGGAVDDIVVERAGPEGVVVRCRAGAIGVAVRLVPPATPDDVTFHVEVVCHDGMVESSIGLGDDYMAPVLDRFLAMARYGMRPLSEQELLAPIALLEAAETALRRASP
jgi:predicted dehydrogenase